MKKLIFLIILFAINNVGFTQNFGEYFKKAQSFYHDAKHLHMEANIILYRNEKDKKGVNFGKGIMYKTATKFYSKFGNYESIFDGNNQINIDHDQKKIHVTKSKLPKIESQIIPDSVFSINKQISYLRTENNVVLFQITIPKGMVEKYIIGFDAQAYYIRTYEYYLRNEKNIIMQTDFKIGKVTYSSVSRKKFDDKVFNSRKYIVSKNGKIEVSEDFVGYTLEINKKSK